MFRYALLSLAFISAPALGPGRISRPSRRRPALAAAHSRPGQYLALRRHPLRLGPDRDPAGDRLLHPGPRRSATLRSFSVAGRAFSAAELRGLQQPRPR